MHKKADGMKQLKRVARVLIWAPLLLIGALILYEAVGMGVNHLATEKQTKQLIADLKTEVPDIELIDVHSETGNTSGTGNHVDCLSSVTFSTKMQRSDLEAKLYRRYPYDV